MHWLPVINVCVCLSIAVVLAYKVYVIAKYRKLHSNMAAKIIVRFARANCIDLVVLLVFATNSGMRTIMGFDEGSWNSIAAEFAIMLRVVSLVFTYDATHFADRQFEEKTTSVMKLVDEARHFVEAR